MGVPACSRAFVRVRVRACVRAQLTNNTNKRKHHTKPKPIIHPPSQYLPPTDLTTTTTHTKQKQQQRHP
jgi:hypothetical protein